MRLRAGALSGHGPTLPVPAGHPTARPSDPNMPDDDRVMNVLADLAPMMPNRPLIFRYLSNDAASSCDATTTRPTR